ncbi:hypothetical protein Tco_0320188 [Tanacetum coccineum]
MAQLVIPAAQLILLDHPLSYALTATADVPVVYLQQFWRTVSKVPGPEEMVFNHCLTTRTSGYNQTKINILQLFHVMINRTNFDYAALLWWDFISNVKQKKEAVQYPRFIKLIIVDLMNKFLEIPKRIDKDYLSIKDDVTLVSVYITGGVRVRGMLIPDEFLTEKIRAIANFKEYETVFMQIDVPMNQPQPVVSTQGTHRSTPRAYRTPTLTVSPQGKKLKQSAGESSTPQKSLKTTIRQQKVVEQEKDNDDSENRLEPRSHKDNPKTVDDDADNYVEKVDAEERGKMGNLETQTIISTPPRSPRIILSSDKNITQDLTDNVPLPTTTTSIPSHSKR